ncbi:uncharacterized protein LOC135114875 isoform X2 [Scylla paramamosain]|uniref:uncharacterized protein LOC135114875 isoform X2 n=1 Tax=Scylla paramamosain TaxID=85552 RepID=UPI0030833122
MPRLTRKTKGTPEGSGVTGGLAEGGSSVPCSSPSYRTRARVAAWAHGSWGREGTARKVTDSPVDADGNRNLEAKGHGSRMVLVQDPSRVRRVAGNNFLQTGSSGLSIEQQSTCSYFQDISLLGKRSDLKTFPLQQCHQDARQEQGLEVPVRCSRMDKDVEQGQSTETTVKCGTDSCSGANVECVKIQQTPLMMLSIQKVNSKEIWITRYVGQQPGQQHQGCADASEPVMEEAKTSTVLSVTEQEMPMSQGCSVGNMIKKTSDDRSYVIDSALSPVPSFRETLNPAYDMMESYADLVVKEGSFGPSSCRINKNPPVLSVSSTCTMPMVSVTSAYTVPVLPMSSVCPAPGMSVSTVCTAPFPTSASDYMDDKDALVLLRNTAFESLSEARATEPNIYASYPRAQCRITPVTAGYRDMSIPDRQDSSLHVNSIAQNGSVGGGGDSVINVIHSNFSNTGAHQLDPSSGLVSFQGGQVVWTAQDPKFSITSIIPSGKNSEGLMDSLQNGEVGNSVSAPSDVRQTESAVQEQEYLYVETNHITHMIDEYLSKDACHSEADSRMQGVNYKGSNYLAHSRDAIVLNETERNCTSVGTGDIFGTSSKKVCCTRARGVGELRLLSEGEDTSALPPTLSDLMPEDEGGLNDFTPSDQDYTLLPLWTFSGDEGNSHGFDIEKPQVSGSVMRTTCIDSTITCPKTTSSEDGNFSVNDFNDLLDSLLQDTDKEKGRSHTEMKHTFYENTDFPACHITSEETPVKETTEYILRDMNRMRLGVGLAKSEPCPKPVLAQVEEDPSENIVILGPDAFQRLPKPTTKTLQGNCLIPNLATAGKVPHTVSFKTVPAVRTPVIQNITTVYRPSVQPTTTTTTAKQSQPQENTNYVKILPKGSSDSCSTKKPSEASCHHPSTLVPAPQIKSSCHVSKKTEMVLPVGGTGMSIIIPKCTPVSIASFVHPRSHDVNTKTVPDHTWPGVKSTPEEEDAVLLQATNAPATMSDELCLNVKKADITPAVTKLSKVPILTSSSAELVPLLSSVPLVLLAPVSEQSLMIRSVPESILLCNTSAPSVSGYGAQATRKAGTKCCLTIPVHPNASKNEKIDSAVCSPQISATSGLKSSSVTSSSTIQTRAHSQRSAETKTVADSWKHQPRKKPYSDSVKTRKLLQEDLKELLPNFSDSILTVLDLPPRAVHRGFFYMGEVKALRNQALGIQLETLYRDHVYSCTSETCLTCVAFCDQKAALSQAEREVHVPGIEKTGDKRKKQLRGKRTKGYDSEDEDELLFSSPSPQPVKKRDNKWDESVDQENVHSSNIKETNEIHSILPERSSQVWGEVRMKRSKSDTNLPLHSKKTKVIREHHRYSYDDSCLTSHFLPLSPSRTSPRPSLRRWKKLTTRKEVPQKTKHHTYSLRSDQWASLIRATLADLRLKQKLERGHVPYSEGQEEGESKTLCGSLPQDTIVVDILSITVGTHDLSVQGEPPYCSKLYVCFSDRKLVYALSTRKQAVNRSEEDMSPRTRSKAKEALMKEAQHARISSPPQDKVAPHPFIFIVVPFDSLLSLNVTSKRVVVVVDTLPSICLMTWKEGCWLSLSQNHPVSPACRSHLALTKALLAVFPMHQVLCGSGLPSPLTALATGSTVETNLLVLREMQSEALQRSLAKSSVWFRQILDCSSPIQGDHIPSWALPSPAVLGDLTSTGLPTTPSLTSITSPSIPSFTSTTLSSSPSCTSALTSTFTSTSALTSVLHKSATSSTLLTGQCSEEAHQVQTLSPMVCGAGASLSSSAPSTEAPIVSAVRSVLQANGLMHALPISHPLQYPPNIPQEEGCSCKGMCRTRECPCARAGGVCLPKLSCFCQECDNPLNVLHTFGLDVCLARTDKCLMQNLYSYNLAGLCTLLVSPVVLPCCGASPKLFHIIPGTVACAVCSTPVSYSWCSHHIHLQGLCPRNHCIKCWCCKPVFHTHCQRCEQCTRSVLQGQCAECGTNKSK